MMQTSSLRRQMKNMVNKYTEAEIKVREATSNDHWGPSSSLMSEISDLTYNALAHNEVMGMIWKRLNDHGKNWRHVYKALTLLDYLVKTGSERVAKECRDNIYTIQTLRDFQYIDKDGHDQGINVREKAKQLVALLRDEERLKKERSQALKTKQRMAGVTSSVGSGSMPPPYSSHIPTDSYREEFETCRSAPSSFHSSTSSPHLAPDLEQARPATSGEEELQLQLALAMSREESEKPPPTADVDEQTQLQIAMTLSTEAARKPVQRAPAASADMDEDAQLQLALSLSKEEHQQEELSRQGDEMQLQKVLEESKREMAAKGGTSFMDLVDVFAVPAGPPPSDPRWKDASHHPAASAGGTDPWDSLDDSLYNTRADSPWMVPPTSDSPPPPWEPPSKPWSASHGSVSKPNPASQVPVFPAKTASLVSDPFMAPPEMTASKKVDKEPPLRCGSPSDGDLFDEAMDGGQDCVNGRGDDSPEPFDLSRLGESLPDPARRSCRTPEAFLDPTAASLVNLDILIPANPPPKNKNPFVTGSGLSAPSAANPFQTEQQPKRSLNQMGSGSVPSAPSVSSLPYSASLPLPTSHHAASIPSSLTHPTQPSLNLPGNLPEPLLPFSGTGAQGSQAPPSSQNPFL